MPQRHRIPDRLLGELSAGAGGREAMALLADIWHSRNRTLLIALVGLTRRMGRPETVVVDRSWGVLADLADSDPDAVRGILCYPPVSAWLAATVDILRGRVAGRPDPGHLALVAAAAAVRGGRSVRLPIADTGSPLLLPSLGRATFRRAGPDLRVEIAGGVTELHRGGDVIRLPADVERRISGWRGLPRVVAGSDGLVIRASLDGSGWGPAGTDFGVRMLDESTEAVGVWRAEIASGWRLLARHHRGVAEEIAAAITALVPLGRDRPGMISGTLRQAYGAIALSMPPAARITGVTLAHEVQHSKLAVLMQAVKVLEPDDGRLYDAPWRADPRPLAALLQGTYAHLGVAAFWRVQRTVEEGDAGHTADVEFARWRAAAYEATGRLLASGRLTAVGELVVDGMRGVLRGFLREPVPPAALARATELAERHRRLAARRPG